jgi:hypothetical protein
LHGIGGIVDNICRTTCREVAIGESPQKRFSGYFPLIKKIQFMKEDPKPCPFSPAMSSLTQASHVARDKAVYALLGGRDSTNLGFDTIMTRIRDDGTVVEIFVEECYATWTSQYSVANGVAEFIEGSRSGDDGSKKWPEGWETGGDTISGWKRWEETVSGTTCAARHKGQGPSTTG